MDFSVIFQLRNKKFWWIDVIFYFVISLLIATVFCYIIFLTKNAFQRNDIKKEIELLKTVGTEQQKEYEKNVVNYRDKIKDFYILFKNHEFTSNVFAFMQKQTMQNVWFKQFNLDKKNNKVQLSGESDNMDSFSRQVKVFEQEDNKKYIENIETISSLLKESNKVEFNINITLNNEIFTYISTLSKILEENNPPPLEEEETSPEEENEENQATKSSEKLITSFRFNLNPEVTGDINQNDFTITANVPYGTDVKNLTPLIVISSKSTVSPDQRIAQNFIEPLIYKVTAEDGSTREYKVSVIVSPELVKEEKSSLWIWILTILLLVIIFIVSAIILFIWRKRRSENLNI